MADVINHEFDRAIGAVARRQHGAFHLRQAREAGGSKEMVQARLRHGMFVRLAPRVLAIASHPATWQRQFKAAELSIPEAALADRSAALVHGLPGFRVLRPNLVVPSTGTNQSALAAVRRSGSAEVTSVDGMRVTSLRQTLFDLLSCCPLPTVERAVDEALADRRVTVDSLAALARTVSAARLRHSPTWRALVEARSVDGWQPSESDLEHWLGALLDQLPSHVVVLRQGAPPWWSPAEHRVDAYLPGWGLIVEADGRRWHTRVADFDRDRWRDNLAAAHGHRVLRFTHTHLTQQPADTLALVLQAGRHAIALRRAS